MPSAIAMAFRATILLSSAILLPLFAVFGNHLPDVLTAVADMQWMGSTSPHAPVPAGVATDSPVFRPSPIGGSPIGTTDFSAHQPRDTPQIAKPNTAGADPGGLPVHYLAPAGNLPVDRLDVAAGRAPIIPPADARTEYSRGHFGVSETRLRQLGASYYQLESWKNEAETYRFFCKIPIAGQEQFQAFYATSNDPVRAMNIVIQQIEAWQAQAVNRVRD